MLSDSQKLTVKVAVRRARERGTEAEEIRKLAAGMKVEEKEIRACAEQVLGAAAVAPAESSEYDALRAKLAEPEPSGINLAKELLDLMDHFELAYNAKPVLLQASPSTGWAACSFDADGRRYFVNLRAKRREAAK